MPKTVGPDGQKRPQSDIEAAVEVGRIAVGEAPKDSPRGPRRTLLEDWERPREGEA